MELTALAALSAGAARVAWPLGIVMATVCLIAALRTMVVLRRVFTVLTPPTLDDRCSEFLAAFVFSALLLGLWVLVTFAATIVATLVIMLAVEVIQGNQTDALPLGLGLGALIGFGFWTLVLFKNLARRGGRALDGAPVDTMGQSSPGATHELLLVGVWIFVILTLVLVIVFVACGTGASGWPGFATSLAGLAVGALIASVVVWRVFVNTLPTYGRGPRYGVPVDTAGPFSHGVVNRVQT